MVISRSLGRKLTVTCLACVAFVLLYEVVMFDSREAAPSAMVDPTLPAAGARLAFTATAYCKGKTTASGVNVRTGIAASDPSILPVGSVVNISTDTAKYNGVYTIMDTGPKVQGRLLDIYMWSCHEALAFGRRPVEITVLRLGWNPTNSTPSLVQRLFRRREAARTLRATVEPAVVAEAAPRGTTTTETPDESLMPASGVINEPKEPTTPQEAPQAPQVPQAP
jgi:3D (Asp-Asp-Asp) domain-containing protein